MKGLCLFFAFTFMMYSIAYDQATVKPIAEAPLYIDLSKALGFFMGQRFSLNRIENEYPDLALQARKAEMNFKTAFGRAEKNIQIALQDMLKEKYTEYLTTLEKQIETTLSSQQLNREIAIRFLAEVESRAKGDITSPIFETLLTYQFMDHPVEEFLRGYNYVFRTKGRPKAKNVDFQIRYPISWKQKEGDRPNIIQKFVSKNGRGAEIVMLMVKDIGYTPTKQEIKKFFTERELRETVPKDAKFIYAKPIILDAHKGGMLLFDQTIQRVDTSLIMRNLYFVTIRGSKIIFVQCMVGVFPEKKAELQKRFSLFEPLFRMIANSFVIQEQYE